MPTSSNDSKQTKKSFIKRHKIWSGVIGLFILICLIGALGNNNTPNNSDTAAKTSDKATSKASDTTPAAMPKLNQEARDGKLAFTVTGFRCGLNQIEQPGDSYGFNVSKTGAPYCVMDLSVKNISNAAQTFESDSQYLYGADGKQYSVDGEATIDANPAESNCMLDEGVNPGVTVTCSLAYDVPASATAGLSYALLHDSSLSNGTKVSLE